MDEFERSIGRRASSRLRVSLPARLVSIHSDQRIEVQNVSQAGFKLRWLEAEPIGTEVFLSIAGLELFGRVVWASDTEGGIVLDQPLPEAVVLSMRDQAAIVPPQPAKNDDALFALRNWRRTGGRYWWS